MPTLQKYLLIVYLFYFSFNSIIGQEFRLERPVPDSIQSHGNYLYGEPWFWASGGAHRGLDMWVVYDSVYSASKGYVEFAAYAPGDGGYEPDGFGNYLRIRSHWNNKTIYIYYAHLSALLKETGDSVKIGEPIAISGTTGNSTGPHLHFEIRENNSYYLAERTRRNPELWFGMEGTGAIYGFIPNAEDNTRVDISPDPKPRPPYTTFGYGLTYGFFDRTIGSDDIYKENYAFGDVLPGIYTISALDGEYIRTVQVNSGEVIDADATVNVDQEITKNLYFNLYQNYPNPFNPNTKIKYSIPTATDINIGSPHVSLKVFNILGQLVATLVDNEQRPGNYEIEFNSKYFENSLSSGVYVYRLTVNAGLKKFHESRKMLLLE